MPKKTLSDRWREANKDKKGKTCSITLMIQKEIEEPTTKALNARRDRIIKLLEEMGWAVNLENEE